MDLYSYIKNKLTNKNKIKTKDLDEMSKYIIKNNLDVSVLRPFVIKEDYLFNRIYFQVSLYYLKDDFNKQLDFIKNNLNNLNDWWHVDQINQFLNNVNINSLYEFSKYLINNYKEEFIVRLGYVLLLKDVYKNIDYLDKIFKLFKDDDQYYVIMAEAWLISFLYMKFPSKTYIFLKNSPLNLKIKLKAISKIIDSFQVNDEEKTKIKKLRLELKNK